MTTVVHEGLEPAAEGPQPLQDAPLWSENYCFTAWDRSREIGVWVHTGRTPADPRLWHEMVAIHLPGAGVLVGKNYSRGETAAGPRGSMLELSCEEPFERWSVAYDGLVRPVDEATLRAGGVPDGPERRLRLDLGFRSDQPVWSFGAKQMADHLWSKGHYEQLGTYAGTLSYDGQEVELEMLGWRDHSHGPRDIGSFVRHTLVAAQFENGRSLLAVEIVDEDPARCFAKARLLDGDTVLDEVHATLPAIDDPHSPSTEYTFKVDSGGGPVPVRARQLCQLPMTMHPPNDMIHGRAPAPGAYTLWMGQARFELDGAIGYGHLERAGRLGGGLR